MNKIIKIFYCTSDSLLMNILLNIFMYTIFIFTILLPLCQLLFLPISYLPNFTFSFYLSQKKPKIKKMNTKKNYHNKPKWIINKIDRVHFLLPNYSWAWGLPWHVVNKLRDIGENQFSLCQWVSVSCR